MTWNDHDHRGEYAETSHTHTFWDLNDVAEKHHRHYDDENTARGLREDLGRAETRIGDLEDQVGGLRRQLDDAVGRIAGLEKQTPQARQLQLEADQAAADLAESGYDRHGRDCRCPFCYYDPEDEDQADEPELPEHDPGPEADDEGGMSEYRYILPEDYQRGRS